MGLLAVINNHFHNGFDLIILVFLTAHWLCHHDWSTQGTGRHCSGGNNHGGQTASRQPHSAVHTHSNGATPSQVQGSRAPSACNRHQCSSPWGTLAFFCVGGHVSTGGGDRLRTSPSGSPSTDANTGTNASTADEQGASQTAGQQRGAQYLVVLHLHDDVHVHLVGACTEPAPTPTPHATPAAP